MSVSSTGDRGEPQFDSTGNAPTFAADLTAAAAYAAEVGSHVVGTTSDRNAYDAWTGLLFDDTDTGIVYRYAGGWKAWCTAAPISFTPTWGGLTIGNGAQVNYYSIAGGWYLVSGHVTMGTTSAMGSGLTVTTPVNMATTGHGLIGGAEFTDASASTGYDAWVRYNATGSVAMGQKNADQTYLRNLTVASTVPFTWDDPDTIGYHYMFRPAS